MMETQNPTSTLYGCLYRGLYRGTVHMTKQSVRHISRIRLEIGVPCKTHASLLPEYARALIIVR